MYRNYFYLLRQVSELKQEIENWNIFDIYSQEKDILFFEIQKGDLQKTLVISTNLQKPYFIIKDNHRKTKKNFASYFSNDLPAKFTNISISGKDRIIKFSTNNFDFCFAIRGPRTNIFFQFRNDEFSSFKKVETEILSQFFDEIKSDNFLINKNDLLNSILQNDFNIIKKNERRINPKIWNEYSIRFSEEYSNKNIAILLDEILNQPIKIILDENTNQIDFIPNNWFSELNNSKIFEFDLANEAIQKYISLLHKYTSQGNIKGEISKKIEKDLIYWADKINKLKERIDNGPRDLEYSKMGSLLLSNLYNVKKGMSEIDVVDYETNQQVKIKLNPKLEPNKNVDYYFEKSKDEKVSFKKSLEIYEHSLKKYNELIELKNRFESTSTLNELIELRNSLKGNQSKERKKMIEEKIKYRKYIVENKYEVFVGKDSESNDKLTFQVAKQNDYWFHARGLSGSHTVLRIQNTKEVIPKSVIKKAASIAAFYSKGKTAKLVPVAYTFRKFVRKAKGMPAGKVLLSKENVIIVSPEIPKDAEEIYE